MKRIILLAACIGVFSNVVISQRHIVIDPVYKPQFTADELLKRLELSESKRKPDSLANFFMQWNRSIPANTQKQITQNDTVHAVHEIFKLLYKPRDLLQLGKWEWGNKLNENSKYVVVETVINFIVLQSDTLEKVEGNRNGINSTFDFRPVVDIDSSQVLYLTAEYQTALNKFLGSKYYDMGTGNLMNPATPKGQSEKRYNLLRPYIPILHGHWGGYWHIDTHPNISRIVFNKQLTNALVYFRVGYQGGEAIMIKANDKWTIQESKETWIE